MAWDFETDPEYQEKLDWADEFVREEVEPLDYVFPHQQFIAARRRASARIIDPLKDEVRAPGPVGHPPRSRARRPGLRPAEAGAAQRDPRPLAVGVGRVRVPGARHRQRRDHRPLRHRRSRRSATCSRCSTASASPRYSMTEPHAGADPTLFTTRAVKDGDEWVINGLEVLLVERQDGVVPHRHGGDQPRRERVQGHVDVPGADRHARASTSSATSACSASR